MADEVGLFTLLPFFQRKLDRTRPSSPPPPTPLRHPSERRLPNEKAGAYPLFFLASVNCIFWSHLGPVQTPCFCRAELNSGIKFYKSTAEARRLNQTFELIFLYVSCPPRPPGNRLLIHCNFDKLVEGRDQSKQDGWCNLNQSIKWVLCVFMKILVLITCKPVNPALNGWCFLTRLAGAVVIPHYFGCPLWERWGYIGQDAYLVSFPLFILT